MAAESLEMHRLQELVRLHRGGTAVREVARLLGMGPNTERAYRRALSQAGLLEGAPDELPPLAELKAAIATALPKPELPPQQRSAIARWRPHVESLMVEHGMAPKAIWRRLHERHGDTFDGTYAQVKRLCRTLRRERGVQPEDVAIVVDTAPGEVAQVDFGYVGRLFDPSTGALRRAWCFVMVLGFSRHAVARLVFDQSVRTWLRVHVECFEELGAVPRTVVPDNLKAAVIRAAFGRSDKPALQRSYRELGRHYGFQIDPTPPYAPNKKGKVESAVRYLKRSVLAGRDGQDLLEVQALLSRFLREEAGHREHGTTGKQPLLQYERIEREAMRPLPSTRYVPVVWKEVKVHRDSHITFDKRLYSVPWRWMGQTVWVRASPATVDVYADDERIASHPRRGASRRSTDEAHLPDGRRDLRHRSREWWVAKAAGLGDEVREYIEEVFDSDDVLSQLRTVQAIVNLLAQYPAHRARAAAKRARFYGITDYAGVKRILVRALDLEPLPTAVEPPAGHLAQPRFARDIGDLFVHSLGGGHEPH
jgi:transposase